MFGEFNDYRPSREGVQNETAAHARFLEVFLHDRLGKDLVGLAVSDNDPLTIERLRSGAKPSTVEISYERDVPTKLTAAYRIGPSAITVELSGGLLIEYTALHEHSSER